MWVRFSKILEQGLTEFLPVLHCILMQDKSGPDKDFEKSFIFSSASSFSALV